MTTTQPPPQAQSTGQEISPEENAITSTLAQDRPTIDAGVKSFLSWICARSLTASETDAQSKLLGVMKSADIQTATSAPTTNIATTQQQALQVARAILQSCNGHEFPIHKTVANELQSKPNLSEKKQKELLEMSVVARLWNGLVQSKQKPTRFLGRRSLRYAWDDMDVASKLPKPTSEDDEAANMIYNQQLGWIEEFGRLLRYESDPNSNVDNDAALIWDSDGGQAELAKRRERRKTAATERGPVTPS